MNLVEVIMATLLLYMAAGGVFALIYRPTEPEWVAEGEQFYQDSPEWVPQTQE